MMKKLISALLAFILILALSVSIAAADPIDTKKESSLTLVYKFNEKYFEGLEIKTFKIAEVFEDGTFELCSPFDMMPVSIHGITTQEEWNIVTSTLASYAKADKLEPDAKAVTDENGTVKFEKLSPGMYLTLGAKMETENEITKFENFITVIPSEKPEGGHNYDVTAYPKCESFIPTVDEVTYKVVKQWADTGYTEKRPESVEIDILRDGELYKTERLSPENNWSLSWTCENDGAEWQAVERNVPEKYTVTVSTKVKTIIITNTYDDPDSSAPQTGDTLVLLPYILATGFAGGVIVIIAIWRKRTEEGK